MAIGELYHIWEANSTAAPQRLYVDDSTFQPQHTHHLQPQAGWNWNWKPNNELHELVLKMAKIMLPCISDAQTKNELLGLILQLDPFFSTIVENKETDVLDGDLFEL